MSRKVRSGPDSLISRRQFAGILTGSVLAVRGARTGAAGPYRVARSSSADAYAGTVRALDSSGEFPAVAGRTVVIKPNLVAGRLASTGVTTDPEAVRAVVDRALDGGAAAVKIVEGGTTGANFTACGYDFFATYDPRVTLVDLSSGPVTFAPVPAAPVGSLPQASFTGIYLPDVTTEPGTVFISVAKLKTHAESGATLSVKNLYGLPPPLPYQDPGGLSGQLPLPRYILHDRSLGQTIVDLALTRPIDYAVVEGVWGLEGNGPLDVTGGTPVASNLIVAGANAVAVDLVCLATIGISRKTVQHLEYAYLRGLGPISPSEIQVVGDPVSITPFAPPGLPPKVWCPVISPLRFSPGAAETTTAAFTLVENAQVRVQVLRVDDLAPADVAIRTLHDWNDLPAGGHSFQWDGRDDGGQIVEPAVYGVRVEARRTPNHQTIARGINWVVAAS